MVARRINRIFYNVNMVARLMRIKMERQINRIFYNVNMTWKDVWTKASNVLIEYFIM